MVIGSGATAVTLVPAMAEPAPGTSRCCSARRRTSSRCPARDPIARRLPGCRRGSATRSSGGSRSCSRSAVFQLSRRRPELVKRLIRKATLKQLPPGVDVDTHFKPVYDPWDQRLCLVPDGDLFRAIRHGRASVVTDTIETFTETGVRLTSGDELEADVVVTATGLTLKPFGGIDLDRRR